MEERQCSKCSVQKPLEDYHRDKKGRQGRSTRCKECACKSAGLWRKSNPERAAEAVRSWWAENRDVALERQAVYRAENRDRINAYRVDNPHLGWEPAYVRRAHLYGFDPVVESFTREELIARWGAECAHCGGEFQELDHWPVAVSKGGPHVIENCRPSCRACNSRSWLDGFESKSAS